MNSSDYLLQIQHYSKIAIIISNLQLMKSLILVTIVVTLLSIGHQAAIDPSNYIWINYNVQNQIILNSNNQYVTKLPCQSRIAKCSYNYQVIPPAWKALQDGSIAIPAEDANKEGIFAIKVDLSEPTGQKMNANLVGKISKGYFSVMDSAQFYKQTGYANKNAQGTKYEESPMVKNVPTGFLSLKQVQIIIAASNDREIKKFLQETNDKFAPCRSRINYLKSVKDIFTKQIAGNDKKITDNKKQILRLQQKLPLLKAQRSILLKSSGVSQQIEKINEKLDKLNYQFGMYVSQNLKYSGLAKKSLQKFKIDSVQKLGQANNKEAVKQLQALELKFNNWIVQAIQDRSSLQRGLLSINLLKQTKGLQNRQQIKQSEKGFRSSMVPLVQAKAKLAEIEIKQNDLQLQMQQNNNFLAFIQEKLAQIQAKLMGSNNIEVDKTVRILDQNNFLNIQINRLQQFMKNQIGNCPNELTY